MCKHEQNKSFAASMADDSRDLDGRYYASQGRVHRVLDVCLGPCSIEGCSHVTRYWSLDGGRVVRECPRHDPAPADRTHVISRTVRVVRLDPP